MQEQVKPLRGYSEEKIFYVYLHKRPTDGSVFYVGKGKQRRAWITKSRNPHWLNVVNKHGGFDVEIIKEGLTEQEAFALEAETVAKYGIENLTNQTLGGISTTGMRHTEETRKLQREIAIQKLRENPERQAQLNERMMAIHEKQRNDPEHLKFMSDLHKRIHANMTPEEKEEAARRKTAWLKDENKKKLAIEKMKQTNSSPDRRKQMSETAKSIWENLTIEERIKRSETSSRNIARPEVREKLLQLHCEKVVVNRKFVFKSKIQFLEHIGSFHAPLTKAFESAKKFNFNFCVFKGYFVENYCEDMHKGINEWNGESLKQLDFDCLPRTKAVVMDESVVFLSMKEASIFCDGKSIDATADFITKNMKINKPAMGHFWRVAEVQEIEKEVMKRVMELSND